MRIGVVTTSYPRFDGDPAGAFVRELNHCIEAVGHEVEVVAAGPARDEVSVALGGHGGLFYGGGAPEALRSRSMWPGAAAFAARMSVSLARRARRWDGIVAHWMAPSALAASLVAGKRPLWVIAHGGDVHLLAKHGLTEATARLLLRRRVQLSFVSKALRDRFADAGGTAARELSARSEVCSMGIDTARFDRAGETRRGTRPRLLFLGRLVAIKGVDLLLRAAQEIARDHELVIAGAGPMRAELEALATKLGVNADFRGEVHGEERDRLLASADVVVLPSRPVDGRSEGMPLVALEALAAGAALVVSDCGGLREIPESIASRVPAGNVGALAAALDQALGGSGAPYAPGHWLEERDWSAVAPRLLRGMTGIHGLRRSA